MPRVTVRPLDAEIEVPERETIMGGATAQGHYRPTTCGGEGRCPTYAHVVLTGMERLSPRGNAEARALSEERGPSVLARPVRLACQARAYGDVELEKPGVKPPVSEHSSRAHSPEPLH